MSFLSRIIGPIVIRRLALARRLARQADKDRDPRRYAKAAEAYRAVLALAPLRTDIRVQYGNMLKDSGQLSAAELAYQSALAERPTDSDIYLQLGHSLKLRDQQVAGTNNVFNIRDWKLEAANAYIAALALDPGMQPARHELLALGYQEWQIESAVSVARVSEVSGPDVRLGAPANVGCAWQQGTAMDPQQARFIAAELFEIVLKRPPDQKTLTYYAEALVTGALEPLSMTRNLLASEEFGQRAPLHAPVARYLARTIISEMFARNPGQDAVDAYSVAVEKGYGFAAFLKEMLSSPEFHARVARPLVPIELGQLAEGLIAAHMTAEGCNLMFPPLTADDRQGIAQAQMRSMLHTLAMLAREALPAFKQ